MSADRRLVYWDACVLIAWLEGNHAVQSVLDSLVQDALAGAIELATSNLSIAEVAFVAAERTRGELSVEVEHAIADLWDDDSSITLIEFDNQIAAEARDLIRRGLVESRSLKPADAVHLASAMWAGVSEFHTLEGADRLRRWNGLLGFDVVEPRTERPRLPGL